MAVLRKLTPEPIREAIGSAIERHTPVWLQKSLASGLTVGGLALESASTKPNNPWAGVAMTVVAEVADDIDGDTARRFGSTSKATAILDAGCDRVKRSMQVYRGFKRAAGMEQGPAKVERVAALGFIAAKQAANTTLATIAQAKGNEPKVALPGQVNMWLDGVAAVAMRVEDAAESATMQRIARYVTRGALLASIVPEAFNVRDLWRQAYPRQDELALHMHAVSTPEPSPL